jgi:N-acetylglutamate synthase-like GNAT family acetyltransferase
MQSLPMTAQSLTTRYARAEDVPALHALIESAYRGEEARRGWTHEADLLVTPRTSEEELRGLIADPRERFLLAEGQGGLVACCRLKDEGEGVAYFGMFAVRPGAQAAGLGKAVLAEAEARVRTLWGAHTMVMTVIDRRAELIAWYERRGFVRTGGREPFPFDLVPDEPCRGFDLVWLAKALT